MKRALIVAYHFPPLAGGSGIQRTLRFVQHLPQFGWQPLVLTVHPRAYERTDAELLTEVPAGTVVRRAFALDTARQLAIGGRYVASMARPDRWASWRFGAMLEGLKMIREFRPQVLFSTYPIATAHVIGAGLQRRSGLPWFADFRDPMGFDDWPEDPLTRERFHAIEREALQRAAGTLVTTPGALRLYRQRYPEAAGRVHLLENGYDEESFVRAGSAPRAPLNPGAVTLLHSGIVYPSERDPTQLLEALGALLRAGRLDPQRFRLRFRAAVHDGLLREIAERHGALPLIELCPPVGYAEALQEMLAADALLVLQAANCNDQIPAKLYEYMRAGRPMLCLTDPAGDTAAVLRESGGGVLARLDSAAEIGAVLPGFIDAVRAGSGPVADPARVHRASRAGRTESLAALFDSVVQRTGR